MNKEKFEYLNNLAFISFNFMWKYYVIWFILCSHCNKKQKVYFIYCSLFYFDIYIKCYEILKKKRNGENKINNVQKKNYSKII